MHRMSAGDVPEHLDAEAAVEVLRDPALPGAADDLRVSRRIVRGWVMMWSAIVNPRSIGSGPADLVDQAILQRLAASIASPVSSA